MRPAAWPEPDPQIAAAIKAMYGSRKTERPLAVEIRDRLGQWLADEDFAVAFGVRGRPGWSPSRLALVTVLQRAEKLTDRAAAGEVRTRLDWKYLLGLSLDDPGFDHTVLAEFRGKVAEAGLEQVALDALLARLAAGGLIKAGGKQRTDSTHVVAAVAALNRLELAGESVRAAVEALAAAHPGVAIRVLLALDGLGAGLQAVPQRSGQQPPDAVVGDPVPLAPQFPGQIAGRLGSPPQPGHRIAPGLRLDQRVQRIQQRWIGLRERHPPPAGPARTPRHRVRARLQLLHPGGHRYPRHPGRLGHQRDPAITQRPGLSRQQQTALPLVQMRQDHLELRCQHPLINLHDHGHTRSMAGQSGHVKVNLRQALSDPGG